MARTIGITGPSGAGKTAVARELARRLPGSGILCTDSYYRDLSALAPPQRAAVNFDAPSAIDWDLLSGHFDRLRSGRSVAVPRYDFSTHTRLASLGRLGPCGTIVLEGLFSLASARIRSRLDLAVFLDASDGVCLARRIARDTAERGRTQESVREQWRCHVRPMYRLHVLPTKEQADLVLRGDRPPGESAQTILRQLASGSNGESGVPGASLD